MNCSDLLVKIKEYDNSKHLQDEGGYFGCSVTSQYPKVGMENPCTARHNHSLTLNSIGAASCSIMYVCIQFPTNDTTTEKMLSDQQQSSFG